jgi:hypothetical protein
VGTPQEKPAERKITDVAFVTPGYFATMGIPDGERPGFQASAMAAAHRSWRSSTRSS